MFVYIWLYIKFSYSHITYSYILYICGSEDLRLIFLSIIYKIRRELNRNNEMLNIVYQKVSVSVLSYLIKYKNYFYLKIK